jgi:hypothetical protein
MRQLFRQRRIFVNLESSSSSAGNAVDLDTAVEDNVGNSNRCPGRCSVASKKRSIHDIHLIKLVQVGHENANFHNVTEIKTNHFECTAKELHAGPRLVFDSAERRRLPRVGSHLSREVGKSAGDHYIIISSARLTAGQAVKKRIGHADNLSKETTG